MRKPVKIFLWIVVVICLGLPVLFHVVKGSILRLVTIRLVEAATGFDVELGTVTVVDHRMGRREPITLEQEVNAEKVYHDVSDFDTLTEDLTIDFTVDALVAGFGGLNDAVPELADGIKEWLRKAREYTEANEEEMEDATELFKDLFE